MTRVLGAFFTILSLVVPATTWADTQTWTDTIPVASTNWSGNLSVPLFNPSLGSLISVDITLDGSVSGTAKYENLSASPATINLNLQATITLTKPDTSTLVQIIPLANISDPATAYDLTTDFDGDSGGTFSGLSGAASDSTTLTAPADLALFTGIGTISLPASATGASFGSGSGNLITQFSSSAGAGMTVKYNYSVEVPEPGTLALLSGGLLIAAVRRRPRR